MIILPLFTVMVASLGTIFFILWNRNRIIIKAKFASVPQKDSSNLEEEAISEENLEEVKKEEFVVEPVKTSYQEIAKLLKRAEILLSHNEEEEAERALVSILAQDEDNIEAHVLLASLYLKRKQHSRAEALYRNLNEFEKGKNAATLSNLAYCLFEQNKIDECIEFYWKALEIEPKNVKRYTNLGQVLYVTKELEEAIKLFKKAQQLAPRDTEILFMLADTLRDARKFEKAIETYRKILHYEPYNSAAREEVAKIGSMGYEEKVKNS